LIPDARLNAGKKRGILVLFFKTDRKSELESVRQTNLVEMIQDSNVCKHARHAVQSVSYTIWMAVGQVSITPMQLGERLDQVGELSTEHNRSRRSIACTFSTRGAHVSFGSQHEVNTLVPDSTKTGVR
jgi:hypothetical protein